MSADAARASLVGGRLARAARRWRSPQPRLELLGLPQTWFRYAVAVGERTVEASCLVDCVLGHAAWIEGEVADAASACRNGGRDDGRYRLPARRSASDGHQVAHELLVRRLSILHRGRSWELVDSPEPVPVSYPYWALYFRRRRGWDLRLLDAVTGRAAGSLVKRSVVTALVAAAAWQDGASGDVPGGDRGRS